MKIAISAESTIDLTKELLEKYDIKVIPYTVILGDKDLKDGEIDSAQIFDFVQKNKVLPKTTALNDIEYREFFEELLKEYDAIIHFALSSKLSSSCSHAQNVAKDMQNVYVIDSESLSTGIACSAIYARKLSEKIDDAKKIAEMVDARKKAVQASFIVEKLDYLHKGGRCSGLVLLGANLLKIRPRLVLKDGSMKNDKKYKGNMPFAVKKYAEECLAEFHDIDTSMAFVTYSSATPEMIAMAKNALIDAGVTTIYETNAGATVTSHCGENTIGILYFNDGIKTLEL